jgi:YgiT-type zinc finger domain-containing protein
MSRKYGDCIYCGGKIEERQTLDYRYHNQLFIVENIPIGVCIQCGEKFLTSKIAKRLEKLASSSHKKVKTVAIPVLVI